MNEIPWSALVALSDDILIRSYGARGLSALLFSPYHNSVIFSFDGWLIDSIPDQGLEYIWGTPLVFRSNFIDHELEEFFLVIK